MGLRDGSRVVARHGMGSSNKLSPRVLAASLTAWAAAESLLISRLSLSLSLRIAGAGQGSLLHFLTYPFSLFLFLFFFNMWVGR